MSSTTLETISTKWCGFQLRETSLSPVTTLIRPCVFPALKVNNLIPHAFAALTLGFAAGSGLGSPKKDVALSISSASEFFASWQQMGAVLWQEGEALWACWGLERVRPCRLVGDLAKLPPTTPRA